MDRGRSVPANRRFTVTCSVVALALSSTLPGSTLHAQSPAAQDSARRSIAYLGASMDQFHDRFPVYDDVSSAGNHFHAYAKIPGADAPVTINGSWMTFPHSGATAIRCEFATTGGEFAGFYFQNGTLTATVPEPNFGTIPNAGVDLTGATALTFWARGERGGEQIDFFMAGVGRNAQTGIATEPYPDSSPRRPAFGSRYMLNTAWQKITIDLTGMDLRYVLGGFGWVASKEFNPSGAVFYLDDIQYELNPARRQQRLNEPRFIRSFTTLPVQADPFDANTRDDFDFVLRNMAFTYDNAVALLAFLAEGSPESLRRARLIGDALVYATQHDRYFLDSRSCNSPLPIDAVNGARLRTAYAAGDIALPSGWTANGRPATVPSPGFYLDATQTFYEVEQEAVDTGNNAWAMLALTALYERTQGGHYLETACKLGQFVRTFRAIDGQYRGFLGGVQNPESPNTRVLRSYASSEHNIDLYAAFSKLSRLTGTGPWNDDAEYARSFIAAMWEPGRGCYLTGTINPNTRNANAGQLPVDVQGWSVLSIPTVLTEHPNVLRCAELNHALARDGFVGFDFNEDRDAIWFEGTGQMAVAYAASGRVAEADTLRQELRRAQQGPAFGDGFGLVAASIDGLTTGFTTARGGEFVYFRRLHIAATAWNVFAQLAFNPFTGESVQGSLAAPTNLAAQVSGLTVTLSWVPSPGSTSTLLEAGSAPGLKDVFSGDVGATSFLSATAPAGIYYVRVRGKNATGTSAPSAEIAVVVGTCAPPPAPTGLAFTVVGSTVTLNWNGSAGASSYVLEAGTAPGLLNILRTDIGSRTSLTAVAPPNTYYVRLRAVSACGLGTPSAEIVVPVP